ncbi:MAG: hypothetical protein KDJ65_26090 [Anaerolineae bacterium]|nr:hypothetical protein [Anaerolineae bacterium]
MRKLVLHREFQASIPWLVAVYLPTLIALYVLIEVNLRTGIPVAFLTRDPAAAMNAPFYVGIFSNVGILFWCSTAAICLFSYRVLPENTNNREWSLFFLSSGLITGWLLLDDLFLFHEEVFPEYLFIPQKVVFAGYGVLIITFLARFKATILNTAFLFLLLSFGFFGMSIFVDGLIKVKDFHIEFIAVGFRGRHLLEDGFKLLGIVSWSAYFMRTCLLQLRQQLHASSGVQLER